MHVSCCLLDPDWDGVPSWPTAKVQKHAEFIERILTTMADEDLIDYNEEEEQTEIVAEKESKK